MRRKRKEGRERIAYQGSGRKGRTRVNDISKELGEELAKISWKE